MHIIMVVINTIISLGKKKKKNSGQATIRNIEIKLILIPYE